MQLNSVLASDVSKSWEKNTHMGHPWATPQRLAGLFSVFGRTDPDSIVIWFGRTIGLT